eukprot:NODE_2367_length_1218_cov_20.397776_g2159_i0.p1 GENE.NODE_2367_length_1218_cov_20.397776_g2159_i0~~NODE_2367_length_1218_cov_20.397776_g2159_i0.p1  ORF type:complete len:222 (+),score=24.73 NODE_2367_length_1218_cov_20.397776_g2159_i0:509-1174(+)
MLPLSIGFRMARSLRTAWRLPGREWLLGSLARQRCLPGRLGAQELPRLPTPKPVPRFRGQKILAAPSSTAQTHAELLNIVSLSHLRPLGQPATKVLIEYLGEYAELTLYELAMKASLSPFSLPPPPTPSSLHAPWICLRIMATMDFQGRLQVRYAETVDFDRWATSSWPKLVCLAAYPASSLAHGFDLSASAVGDAIEGFVTKRQEFVGYNPSVGTLLATL